jgi:hypothetical protein
MSGVIYEADACDRVRTDRRVDVVGGEGMVTPAREFTVNGEQLQPGRDRFAPHHEFVRARPELFVPCMKTDTRTRDVMRSMYERAEAELLAAPTRTTGTSTASSAGPLRLP